MTAAYYHNLGFSKYHAIDINDRYGSLVMDLNRDLQKDYDFTDTYDLVTNNGTGEHIFDQASVMRNIHNLTKTNGTIIHVMPMLNWVNHGFYCFHPSLYYSLSRANDYQMLGLGLAIRAGVGVMVGLSNATQQLPSFLMNESRIDLETLLAAAKFDIKGRRSVLTRLYRLLRPSSRASNELADVVDQLVSRYKDISVVAVLRKVNQMPFQVPIQTLYANDFSDPAMQSEYAVGTPIVQGAR